MEDAFVLDLLCSYDDDVLEIYLDEDDTLSDAFASLDEDRLLPRGYPQQRSTPDASLNGCFASWARFALTSDELDEILRVLSSDDTMESESKPTGSVLDGLLVDIDSDDEARVNPRYGHVWQGSACRLLDLTPAQLTALLRPTSLSWSGTEDWISASVDEHSVWRTPALLGSEHDSDSRCQYGRCSRAAVVLDWCLAHADLLFSSHKSHYQQQTHEWPSQGQAQQQEPVSMKKRCKRRRAVFSTAKKKKQQQQQPRKASAPRSSKPPRQPRTQQPQPRADASETALVSIAGAVQYSTIRTRRNRRITYGDDDELEIAL